MFATLLACVAAATVPTAELRTLPELEVLSPDLVAALPLPDAAPPGLSGLALDSEGRAWAVAERDEVAVRLAEDGAVAESLPLQGLGARDGESLAWLPDGRLALGSEPGRPRRADRVLLLQVSDGVARKEAVIRLDYAPFGLRAEGNRGLEGLTASGDWLIAASEMVVEEDGLRDAPLWLTSLASGEATLARLRLSSDTGKVSAVEAWTEEDGSLSLLVIERHFGVARLLLYRDVAAGGGLAPTRVIDLWPTVEALAPEANLEGLCRDPDGGLLLVSDNQYTEVSQAWMLQVSATW